MANQPATTVKDVKVPGNSDAGCTRACNGNSTCGGVCGRQCYKQVFTNPKGVETIGVYSCRGDLEIVDPKPRTVPTTAAAFLSTVGSPQQDVFETGSSQFITVGYTVWNLASAENNRCSCNRGRNTGCNLCGVDRNRCYSLLPIRWESEGGGVWKFTVLQSFFTCIVDRRDPNSGQLYPWPDGEYRGDPRLGHSRPDDQTVVYGYRVAESFRRGNGWQSIPISQL